MSPPAPDVPVAELEDPAPWRSPVPFLWLAIAMLLMTAVAVLVTGAADRPEEQGAPARGAASVSSGAGTHLDRPSPSR